MEHHFQKGDIVESSDPQYPLRSGASEYAAAAVISESPLVLASVAADMRWQTTVRADKLRKIGAAAPEVFARCMRRVDA